MFTLLCAYVFVPREILIYVIFSHSGATELLHIHSGIILYVRMCFYQPQSNKFFARGQQWVLLLYIEFEMKALKKIFNLTLFIFYVWICCHPSFYWLLWEQTGMWTIDSGPQHLQRSSVSCDIQPTVTPITRHNSSGFHSWWAENELCKHDRRVHVSIIASWMWKAALFSTKGVSLSLIFNNGRWHCFMCLSSICLTVISKWRQTWDDTIRRINLSFR